MALIKAKQVWRSQEKPEFLIMKDEGKELFALTKLMRHKVTGVVRPVLIMPKFATMDKAYWYFQKEFAP